jgi:uncharacterized protein (DUF697 family)
MALDSTASSLETNLTESRKVTTNKLINSATAWAAAATLIPINGLDLAALAAVEANLVINISAVYGEKLPRYAVTGAVSTLLGTLLPMYGAQLAVPILLKWIPFGNLVGATTMAGFGAAATYAIGKVFESHYEKGGTFANFNPANVTSELKTEFAANK